MNDIKQYKLKYRYGIHDLQGEYAFVGNSQGDTSCSNNIQDYIEAKGWMSFVFKDIDINDQEAINKESLRRKEANIKYIEELKSNGKYGEEYEVSVKFKRLPEEFYPKSEVKESTMSASFHIIDLNGRLN